MDANSPNQKEMPEKAEMARLLALARQGDYSVLPQLQEFLDNHPEIWQQVGDLAEHAREALITLASGTDLAAAESMRRKMHQLQEELAGDSNSPTIRLLAEQCVLCWAQLHWAGLLCVGKDLSGAAQGSEIQRRLNAIQHRYVQALKTLTTVRRLLVPAANPGRPNLKVVSAETIAG
jgi:hypothetical protein